ncbi:Cadmium-translocating P-type ATPase, partial [Pseudomonas coronafaciens pv. porri]
DKTGTLTFGRLRLQTVQAEGPEHPQLLELAASLGSASSHPVSRALAGLVDNHQLLPLTDTRERQGLGVVASTEHGEAALGRPELFEQLGIATPAVPAHDGPLAGLSLDSVFLAWLLLADSVKPEAQAALLELRELGMGRQLLLTGDRQSVADSLAREIGIADVQAQALPEDKLNRVMGEIASGFRPMVVGDGVNDSLALKAGVVGVA